MSMQNMQHILDIGCETGLSTLLLAENSSAHITAVDNEPIAIEQLEKQRQHSPWKEQISRYWVP